MVCEKLFPKIWANIPQLNYCFLKVKAVFNFLSHFINGIAFELTLMPFQKGCFS